MREYPRAERGPPSHAGSLLHVPSNDLQPWTAAELRGDHALRCWPYDSDQRQDLLERQIDWSAALEQVPQLCPGSLEQLLLCGQSNKIRLHRRTNSNRTPLVETGPISSEIAAVTARRS